MSEERCIECGSVLEPIFNVGIPAHNIPPTQESWFCETCQIAKKYYPKET